MRLFSSAKGANISILDEVIWNTKINEIRLLAGNANHKSKA